ncbi:gliding motility-associated C-terminal domain-containing protein [Daejeonella rubra]|uniref:Gliding motility-associated C-terminal domain-containing protein n=2 Tax=Daejeonella rubra TaxID=990371 RepID=A0A1G9N293_9SPHI|nr:gliding motility-associated C-terminal domain-containing protein [Daejeonella rubra]
MLLMPIISIGQTCTGNFGEPVVNITFESGFNPGPTMATNYNYTTVSCPTDGSYKITSSTFACFNNNWHTLLEDHTPGDANGFMMLVNASNAPGEFFKQTISGLCPGTTYEFSAYVVNVLKPSASGIKPNLTFIIESVGGVELGNYSSGNISESLNPEWKKYGMIFTTTAGISEVVLKIINIAPGGNGNDLALDDITFRACGPTVLPKLNGSQAPLSICEGKSLKISLDAELSSGYNNPSFQWQVKTTGSTWNDIPGANSKAVEISINSTTEITFQYRLAVAESYNINSPGCRILSDILTLNRIDKPIVDAGVDKNTIQNKPVSLEGTSVGNNLTYQWIPSTYLDDPFKLNPIATPLEDITYTLQVTDECNNVITDEVFVKVYKEISIPNTFSPNNDGVNDLWNIIGLTSYPESKIKVFNRYGNEIFLSSGYENPWDGRYLGSELSPGVYYYMIDLNNGTKLISGSVLIVK